MPEGDTVFVAASRLHAALAGTSLTRTEFRVPKFANADLSGHIVNEVVARGKHILLRTSGGMSVHSHLKMDGEWLVLARDAKWPRPAHWARAILETGTTQAVGFRLGILEVFPTDREHEATGHLGPDLLGPDWDAARALELFLAEPARPIANVLLDQSVMAGLGNVFKAEICFLAGIHPTTPVGEIDNPARVIDLAKRVIEANRHRGDQVTTGNTARGRKQWVYGRRGEPCARCGTPVQSNGRAAGERVTYWCPTCQPLPTQTREASTSRA